MNSPYDASTKEKDLVSYELFIDNSLDKLGFRKNTLGTKYLKDLILYIFSKNIYDLFVDRICIEFLEYKEIKHISKKNFITRIEYAIQNVDNIKFKNNFKSVFKTEYDIYYKTPKNLIILFLNVLVNLK